MSKRVKLKFKKGETILINFKQYRTLKPCSLDVLRLSSNVQAQAEPTGDHQTDDSQAVAKDEVLSIIQKEIDALEKHENNILSGGILSNDDYTDLDEDDAGRIEHFGIAAHATIAAQIMNLKKMLKTVSNL